MFSPIRVHSEKHSLRELFWRAPKVFLNFQVNTTDFVQSSLQLSCYEMRGNVPCS